MCDRSLRCRVLISLLVVLMLGFGVLALYLYDTRDQLRRSIMLIQAQAIGAGYTASSDLSTLPTHYAGSELSYTL
jgi:two-component system sensor histidine kinase QseC